MSGLSMKNDLNKLSVQIPEGCKIVGSCLDYQTYQFAVETDLKTEVYDVFFEALKGLGKHRLERLCVTYVYGEWGFLVIPPLGFPELKVNFFHQISGHEINQVLAVIGSLLAQLQCSQKEA